MPKKLSKQAIEGIAVGIIIVFLMSMGFLLGWRVTRPLNLGPEEPNFQVDIDGVVTSSEWEGADYYNLPFYLDVDNKIDPIANIPNVDGWNYISIGEDEDNYYVGLDLCSDRTNNPDGEWISLGIGNRIPEYGGKMAFYALENYGFEYLIYNVSEDQVFGHELIAPGGSFSYYNIPFVPEYNSYEVIRGEMDGDYRDFWARDDWENEFDIEKVATLKSSFYENDSVFGSGDVIAVDFAVNVSKMIPTYNASDLLPTITDFELNLDLTGNISASTLVSEFNETADIIWFAVLEHGQMPGNSSDSDYLVGRDDLFFTNDGTFTYLSADFDPDWINTTDGMYHFSLFAKNPVNATNPTSFELYLNRMSFKLNMDRVDTTLGTSLSSENYQVAFSYRPSDNCAEDHRMFEFRVAKSEFPVVEDDMLYVNVAGYGTMGMEGTNWWSYPGWDLHFQEGPLYEFYHRDNTFLRLDMGTS